MSGIATAIVGSAIIGGVAQNKAASKAAGATTDASRAQIDLQQQQFDEITKILKPYVTAGTGALPGLQPFISAGQTAFEQQLALTGVRGAAAQQAAIRGLESSPEMQAMIRQGENALLQQASATGGLRGGNVQAALAQFRPQMLAQQIGTQLQRLGGIAGTGLSTSEALARLGQASASRQAAAGSDFASSVSGALGNIGAAQSAQALAQGQAFSNIAQSVPSALITSRFLPQQAPQIAAPVSFGASGGFSPAPTSFQSALPSLGVTVR
jgi:hypothetical protein